MDRIRVYVAGKITPTDPNRHPQLEFLENVTAGVSECIDLILAGYAPVCTFFDFVYWLVDKRSKNISIDVIHDVSTSLLAGCQALYVLPGSKKSNGVKKEIKTAKKLGIPIFYSIEEMNTYFNPVDC